MILFKSFNMDEMFKLLVVDDPFSADFDKKREASQSLNIFSGIKLNTMI